MAETIRRLTHEPQLRTKIGEAGQQLIQDRLTWKTIGPRFVDWVEQQVESWHRRIGSEAST